MLVSVLFGFCGFGFAFRLMVFVAVACLICVCCFDCMGYVYLIA